MTLLVFRSTTSEQLAEIAIADGNIIFCQDINTTYIDRGAVRVKAINIAYANSSTEFPATGESTLAYIARDTGFIYLYEKSGLYARKYYYEDVSSIIIQDPTTLEPKVLLHNGDAIAPRTVAEAVYTSDGVPISESLDDIINNKKRVMKTKIYTYNVPTDGLTIFPIPYPTTTFSFETDTMIVLVNSIYIDSQYYKINNAQIIFDNPLNQNDTILFIFHYIVAIRRTEAASDGIGLDQLSTEVINYINSHGGQAAIDAHLEDFDNPHQVTASQVGAGSGVGSVSVFRSATAYDSFTATTETNTFNINFGEIGADIALLDLYFHGLKLALGDDYTISGTTVTLVFTLKVGETINYEISKTGFRYSDLLDPPTASKITMANGISVQAQINKIINAITALGGVL